MTAPRQLFSGATYLVTRRCTQRESWLRPSELCRGIFAYCVAVAAWLTGVRVHGICVLSDHWHVVVTDPEARVSEFMGWVHKYTAKCINASHGRWENMWSNEAPSLVRLEDDRAVLDKLVYCLVNPVSAGLVAHGEKWPGLRTAPGDIAGVAYEVERPPVYFSENGSMPDRAVLKIERPPILPELSDRKLADFLCELVGAREAEIRNEFARAGRRFLGVEGVMRRRPWDRPATRAPRRQLSPRVATRDKTRRTTALRRLKEFVTAYRDVLRRWRDGERDVVFPAGTYAMRVFHGAACVGT